MEISGKVALITGGAHRVGKAITMMLARAGADVVINYNRSAEAARVTADQARTLGVNALALQCDVAKWDSVQAMSKVVQERFGRIDMIVNSASDFQRTPFPSDEVEIWRRVTSVSIDGSFYICNSFVPLMPSNGGAIVNIVDMAAYQPWPNFLAHGVGKAGMLALTRQLALELAPTIRVNAVAPGYVLPPPDFSKSQIARAEARIPLQRWGTPDDVAGAVQYLLEADFVTGEVIVIDGGERLGYV